MAGDTVITVIGNLVAVPELAYTPSGVARVGFTVASTPRRFDRDSGDWKDGDALFLPCTLWREAAENFANSDLPRGARVIMSGRLKQRSFTTREGDKRTVVELEVDEIGPSTRWATAKVNRVKPGSSSRTTTAASGPVTDDPWAGSSTREPAFAGAGTGLGDEPTF